MAIICIVFGVLYVSLLNKQHRAENPGDIHGTYRLKGNSSPETEYIIFDTDKKIIIYYGTQNGKKTGFEEKGTYKWNGTSNGYELDFDGKKASLIYYDDVIWFISDSNPMPFEKTSEVMDITE